MRRFLDALVCAVTAFRDSWVAKQNQEQYQPRVNESQNPKEDTRSQQQKDYHQIYEQDAIRQGVRTFHSFGDAVKEIRLCSQCGWLHDARSKPSKCKPEYAYPIRPDRFRSVWLEVFQFEDGVRFMGMIPPCLGDEKYILDIARWELEFKKPPQY